MITNRTEPPLDVDVELGLSGSKAREKITEIERETVRARSSTWHH